MDKYIKYKTAANLIFLSVGLGGISLFFTKWESGSLSWSIYGLVFLLWIGTLIKREYAWVKYLLLVLMIVGVLSIPFMWTMLVNAPWDALLYIIQNSIQILVLVILFKIKKSPDEEADSFELHDESNPAE